MAGHRSGGERGHDPRSGPSQVCAEANKGPYRVGDLWPESFRVQISDPDREGERGRDWRDFSLRRVMQKNDGFESVAGQIASTIEVDKDEKVSWGHGVIPLGAEVKVIGLS
ncbi:hypothetical protein BDZ91DRAFT_797461 [Kalaharituber pfeilii]|nr:hypothetical protein BDZ91DRAFT_797461 [Kalaharituber pfeilii]